jgi:hypothetical protein
MSPENRSRHSKIMSPEDRSMHLKLIVNAVEIGVS